MLWGTDEITAHCEAFTLVSRNLKSGAEAPAWLSLGQHPIHPFNSPACPGAPQWYQPLSCATTLGHQMKFQLQRCRSPICLQHVTLDMNQHLLLTLPRTDLKNSFPSRVQRGHKERIPETCREKPAAA